MVSQENYWLEQSSFCCIHCLDKEDEGIFQAEICLLEIRQQLKRKSTFLLSHRHSSSMCSMNYCSSQLARLRHTFINLNLHYHTVLIYHLFESFPYSVFFNYFVFIKSSNFENSLFCQFYGNC